MGKKLLPYPPKRPGITNYKEIITATKIRIMYEQVLEKLHMYYVQTTLENLNKEKIQEVKNKTPC